MKGFKRLKKAYEKPPIPLEISEAVTYGTLIRKRSDSNNISNKMCLRKFWQRARTFSICVLHTIDKILLI